MWGQREASQKVADRAQQGTEKYLHAFKHELAGMIRDALWVLRLAESKRQLSQKIYEVAEKLSAVVKRRVDLGDLARADLLLAESDRLEKKTNLIQMEAEVMHARHNYQNLTRMDRAPTSFEEHQSTSQALDERHPSMAAATAAVERAQAEVEFISHSKQGNQPSALIGTDSTTFDGSGSYGTGVNIVLQIPVGGDDWHAPQVAQANLVLNEKIIQREKLWRQLEKALHEAQHNIEVDQAALEIAKERKKIAETQLKMSHVAFESGEIALIDYLKIQANAFAAIQESTQRGIVLQKDTAIYNQVIGVTP
jgi:outer membrane protein TolC